MPAFTILGELPRLYRFYILKAIVNGEEVVEERVLRPGAECRFHTEWQGINGAWIRSAEKFVYYIMRPTRNFCIVETKTDRVVYAVEMLRGAGDAILPNGGRAVAEV